MSREIVLESKNKVTKIPLRGIIYSHNGIEVGMERK